MWFSTSVPCVELPKRNCMESNSEIIFSAHAHGKILLSGEYAILDGAKGFAIPLKKGQTLQIGKTTSTDAYFISLDVEGNPWFEARFHPETLGVEMPIGTKEMLDRWMMVFEFAKQKGVDLIEKLTGIQAVFHLEFPRNWGWGSSSTWISLLAKWLGLDAWELNKHVFGGSGYDVFASFSTSPYYFTLKDGVPQFENIPWNPSFLNQVFLVYLGQKQDSRAGIAQYQSKKVNVKWEGFVDKANSCSIHLSKAENLFEFESYLQEHESIIRILIGEETIQNRLFPDYRWGTVKSLGAWGGDFVLVTGAPQNVLDYFMKAKKLLVLPLHPLMVSSF